MPEPRSCGAFLTLGNDLLIELLLVLSQVQLLRSNRDAQITSSPGESCLPERLPTSV